MKILIVDDEQAIVKMYASAFEAAGDEVISATDGPAGLKMAREEEPGIILLDIIMPKVNGLDVLKTLKEDPETKDIPVILLTNLPAEASEGKCEELGACDYLVKAQNEPEVVVEKVKKILKS